VTEERPRLDEVLADRAKTVDLPAPTAAPLVVAFGASLITAGLVTHFSISVTGLKVDVPAWRLHQIGESVRDHAAQISHVLELRAVPA